MCEATCSTKTIKIASASNTSFSLLPCVYPLPPRETHSALTHPPIEPPFSRSGHLGYGPSLLQAPQPICPRRCGASHGCLKRHVWVFSDDVVIDIFYWSVRQCLGRSISSADTASSTLRCLSFLLFLLSLILILFALIIPLHSRATSGIIKRCSDACRISPLFLVRNNSRPCLGPTARLGIFTTRR